MDSHNIRELFSRTLVGDEDDEGARNAVMELHLNGCREIFELAAEGLQSETPKVRSRASSILGQLLGQRDDDGQRQPLFLEESHALLVQLLEREKEPQVLHAALCALGHLSVSGAVPVILRYQDHPDPQVRFGVAFALGSFGEDPDAALALRRLFKDSDAEIRDWSVFGLGVLWDSDSAEIREDLLERLQDPDENVREEAAVGLAKRGERRLLPDLLKMLEDDEPTLRAVEAEES